MDYSAYHVTEGKGATTWAIGFTTTEILTAMFDDARRILRARSVYAGEHGLYDVALSMPGIVDRRGVAGVREIPLDSDECAALHAGAKTIRQANEAIGE